MQNTKVSKVNENYLYKLFINIKAIKDFLEENKTDQLITKTNQIYVLSFFVAISKMNKGVRNFIDHEGNKFVLANDRFILDNLKYTGVKSGMLKKIIFKLEKAKTIERIRVTDNDRYLRVNPELMKLWSNSNWAKSASMYMSENRPKMWDDIKSEWEPIKGSDVFKEIVDWCNDQVKIQQIEYSQIEVIFKLFQNTFKGWH